MSHHVTQENRVSSHLLSSISFITIPQTPLVNSDYHRKLHKPVGFAYSSLFLPHPSLCRRNATEFKSFFVTWLFRKSLLEATETYKCDCSPNTTETCVSPLGRCAGARSLTSKAGGAKCWARVALTWRHQRQPSPSAPFLLRCCA